MLKVRWRRTVAALSVGVVLIAALPGPIAQAQAAPTVGATPQAQTAPHHMGHHGGMFAVAAQAIGITPQQLRQELPGKSLAQVATANGKNPADVATALKTAASAHIDQAMNHVVQAHTGTAATPPPTGT
jgi:hypothetical protein